MGPKANFFPSFVGRTPDRPKVPLKNCLETGSRKAVDISGWIVAGLKGGEGACARAITSNPAYDPYELLDSIDYKYDTLVAEGIDPIPYFDGDRNPLKRLTNEQRESVSAQAWQELEEYFDQARLFEEGGDINDRITDEVRSEVARLRKKAAAPDEGIYALVKEHFDKRGIEYRCAPFEADGQLASDEHAGIVSGIVTEDGDLVGMGASQLITQIDYGEGLCYLLDCKEWVAEKSEKDGDYWTVDDIPEIAAFCGCDFIPHMNGFGPITVKSLWEQYRTLHHAERMQFLESIESRAELPDSAGGGKYDGWAERFIHTVNFYRYCPVFKLVPLEEGREIDHNDESTYRVVLAPLFPYSGDDWGKYIGYGVDPASLLVDLQYADGYHLRVWTRTRRPLRRNKVPTYGDIAYEGVDGSEPLPPFAELDFFIEPISIRPIEVLGLYLLSRGIFISDGDSRSDVESLVRRVSTMTPAVSVLPPCLKN